MFPRNFAGTGCKYCKNLNFVGLWCVIQTLLEASNSCKRSCFCCFALKKPKIVTLHLKVPHTYTNVYIYIYVVKLLPGPSLASLSVIIWAKEVLFLNSFCQKTSLLTKHVFCLLWKINIDVEQEAQLNVWRNAKTRKKELERQKQDKETNKQKGSMKTTL